VIKSKKPGRESKKQVACKNQELDMAIDSINKEVMVYLSRYGEK
jgi:hypothetical protein